VLAQALRECGPTGVAALRLVLGHEDMYVRLSAVDQLGLAARRNATVVRSLLPLLKDKDPVVRWRVLVALGAAGPNAKAAAEAVAEALRDPNPATRLEAALAVAYIGAEPGRPEALGLIRTALADRNGAGLVPVRPLEALGRLGADAAAAVPDVLPHLARPEDWCRARAAEALGRIGRPAATAAPALTQLLKDNDLLVRIHAAVALWRVTGQAERVVPVLAAALSEPALSRMTPLNFAPVYRPGPGGDYNPTYYPSPPFGISSEEPVVRLVIRTLGEIGPPARSAAPALRAAKDGLDAEVRQAAAEALKKVEPDGDVLR
jgi:HEAT repeat protein